MCPITYVDSAGISGPGILFIQGTEIRSLKFFMQLIITFTGKPRGRIVSDHNMNQIKCICSHS